MDPETDYGSPAWRENHSKTRSKTQLAMHADPVKGPALRGKLSKTMTAKYADPKKGPALREKQSKANYGPAGPPGETKDEKRARVEGLLERVKQRAMTAQTSPGNIKWPEEDDLLVIEHVQTFGDINFAVLAEQLGVRHHGQTCKNRWKLNLDPDGPCRNRFGRCEICARANKGGCGTDRAHSKCLKLKQNGGDIDIGDAKGGEAKTPAAKAPPAKSSPSSNTKGDKKRKR